LSAVFEEILRFYYYCFKRFWKRICGLTLKMDFEVRDEFMCPNYSQSSRFYCAQFRQQQVKRTFCVACDIGHVLSLTVHYILLTHLSLGNAERIELLPSALSICINGKVVRRQVNFRYLKRSYMTKCNVIHITYWVLDHVYWRDARRHLNYCKS